MNGCDDEYDCRKGQRDGDSDFAYRPARALGEWA